MNTKPTKFIIKCILILPIGFVFISLLKGFNINNWEYSLFAGLVFSFGVVFWNLFDYEKHNQMDLVDFLESKHETKVKYSEEGWNVFSEIIKNPFAQLKVVARTEDLIKLEIDQRMFNSVMTVEHVGNEITICIKKKYLSFVPDCAVNYRILQKVKNKMNPVINKALETHSLAALSNEA